MQNAEDVTFGGSGLVRAQALRADADAVLQTWKGGLVLPYWRGRPLVRGTAGLLWLPSGHDLFKGLGDPVLLGVDGGQARFALDVTATLSDVAASASAFDHGHQAHPLLGSDCGFADLRTIMADLSPRAAELAAMGRALLEWHRSHGFCAACGARSEVAMAGWQRQCPACNTMHFPRTDPVVIMLITHGNAALLGRSPGWPEGMYSLLAGFVEPGETMEAAVRREVAEETGVPVGRVRYLASQPWPFPANLMLGCHGQALDRAITLDPAELEDARWITREEAVSVLAGSHPVIKPSRKGSIAQFILNRWVADRLD